MRELSAKSCAISGADVCKKDSPINPLVGVDQIVKPGERVTRGSALCRVHGALASDADIAATRVRLAFTVGDSASSHVDLAPNVIV
jgi:thymidine phosphorylase